jgi:uncharacterized protein YgbK (DUF1537 family)
MMVETSFESLISELPPEPDSVFKEIQARVSASPQKIVVLDDDPTGTQSVHDVSVLTEWSVPVLREELMLDSSVFFILTNSRSLTCEAAQVLNREIGANLKAAASQAGSEFTVISRSDSTLRGHYPAETDALAEGLGACFDGVILAPYLREGGRFTINDVHYVVNGKRALPVGETEFARDPALGYSESDLRFWIEEKSKGKIAAESVRSLSIGDIRTGDILSKLIKLHDGQVCIVNAACDADIERVVLSVLEAESQGKSFLYRTAASFVRARAGIPTRPPLTSAELQSEAKAGGLVIVGSFVPKTNRQLAVLRQKFSLKEIELDVHTLLDDSQRRNVILDVHQKINRAISAGQDVLLFTSRQLVTGSDAGESLKIEEIVSESLVACVRGLRIRPSYFVSKGGTTSSDVAVKGLDVHRALVLGEVLPGIPAWKLGKRSRFPGMVYVVFPGNVGDENALADVVLKFQKQIRTENGRKKVGR